MASGDSLSPKVVFADEPTSPKPVPPKSPKSPSAQQTPPTPQIIRELKNYSPFSRSFRQSLIRRDSFVGDDRAIGVFTSGGDCSGIG
jgi:hypothetical protein